MKRVFCLLLLCSFGLAMHQAKAQTKNMKKLFLAGNKALSKGSSSVDNTLAGDYSRNLKQDYIAQSIGIWKEILAAEPENPDANFKMGLSYYYSYDEKNKALPYLQKAVKKLKRNYSFNNDAGGAAPYYSIFYLAEAFRLNNEPDSALKYYSVYRNKYRVPPISVEKEIFMCLNAKNNLTNIRNVKLAELKTINTQFAESNPVLKVDNRIIFFSSRRPAATPLTNKKKGRNSEDIYISTKDKAGNWAPPLPYPHNTIYDEVPLWVSVDGQTLYIRLSKNKNSDIYITRKQDSTWTKPEPFTVVNSGWNENGISLSSDGRNLYFSSDRSGGTGGYDIYQSSLGMNGRWSQPLNLGFPINTSLNEISPNLTPDGKTLFFSSNGVVDQGTGGYDVYFSNFEAGKWTEPKNMGNPVNKSGDDFGLYNSSDGKRYFSQLTPSNSFDIFEIEGGNFDANEVAANVEVVTVTNEMAVTQVLETEKEVEKEVAVVEAIETQVEVEKEVEVVREIEVEKTLEKEVQIVDTNQPIAEASSAKEEPAPTNSPVPIPMKENNEAAPSPTPRAEITNDAAHIYYDLNKTDIPMQAINDIIPFIEKLKATPNAIFQVIGYSDRKGNWEANLRVSLKRAKKVKDLLVQSGIDAKRIIYYGLGYTKAEAGIKESSKDRKVEINIMKE